MLSIFETKKIDPLAMGEFLNTWVEDDCDAVRFMRMNKAVAGAMRDLYTAKRAFSACHVVCASVEPSCRLPPRVRHVEFGCNECTVRLPGVLHPSVTHVTLNVTHSPMCLWDYNKPPIVNLVLNNVRTVTLVGEVGIATETLRPVLLAMPNVDRLVNQMSGSYYKKVCSFLCDAIRIFAPRLRSIDLGFALGRAVDLLRALNECPLLTELTAQLEDFAFLYTASPVLQPHMKNLTVLRLGQFCYYYRPVMVHRAPCWSRMPCLKSLDASIEPEWVPFLLNMRQLERLVYRTRTPRKLVRVSPLLSEMNWLKMLDISDVNATPESLIELVSGFGSWANLEDFSFKVPYISDSDRCIATEDFSFEVPPFSDIDGFIAIVLSRVPCKRIVICHERRITINDPRVEHRFDESMPSVYARLT